MRPKLKYQVMYHHRKEYPISVMSKLFGVSRSGYYDYMKRMDQPEKDTSLADLIRKQQKHCFQTYGYRRMQLWLEQQGVHRNPKTILRIMKKYDLLSEIRRKRMWKNMGQQVHKYQNLLNREFYADSPNQKWVTDISYIHTKQGVLYLSMIRDLFDNSIVAYKTGTRQTVNLVLNTIRLAIKKGKVKTTGIAGGLSRPYKGLVPATPQGVRKIRQSQCFYWLAPLTRGYFYLPLFTGSPVNGSIYSFMLI